MSEEPVIRANRQKRPYLPPSELPGEALRREMQPGSSVSITTLIATVILTLLIAGILFLAYSTFSGNTPDMPVISAAVSTSTATIAPTPGATPSPTPMDSDADGIPDREDNCILTANDTQADMDEDQLGDACDADRDGDRFNNDEDNCPDVSNIMQEDSDDDGAGDACDNNSDTDDIPDDKDNCPEVANPLQEDTDDDGAGDLCDDAFELMGLTLTTDGNLPIYIGSVDNSLLLTLDFEQPATGSEIEVMVSDGTLHPAVMTCDTPGAETLTIPMEDREFRYCPPEAALDITITARVLDATGESSGIGGQLILESNFDNLTLLLEQAAILNRQNESDDQDETRCYFTDPVGEILLEEQTIPLTFRLETDNPQDGERRYPVTFQIPPEGIYIAEVVDDICGLLTTFDPLQDEASFEAEVNKTYTLYYLPQETSTLNTLSLRAFIPGVPVAPQVLTIHPLIVADTGLNVRNETGDITMAMQNGERAVATGIVGEGEDRWLQIRVDDDDRDLWLNIGLLEGSYEFIAAPALIPVADPPPFAEDITESDATEDSIQSAP